MGISWKLPPVNSHRWRSRVLIGLLLLSCGPVPSPAGSGADELNATRGVVSAINQACPASAGETTKPIKIVGAFTSMRLSDEHAYGYRVELWRQDDRIFGLFMASQGMAGDTPAGLLEDVDYESRTGKLTFLARLTMGIFSNRQHQNVPSRDVFHFAGTLSRNTLRGVLDVSNALAPEPAPHREKIVLRRAAKESQAMRAPGSCSQWAREVAEIMEFRGPKW